MHSLFQFFLFAIPTELNRIQRSIEVAIHERSIVLSLCGAYVIGGELSFGQLYMKFIAFRFSIWRTPFRQLLSQFTCNQVKKRINLLQQIWMRYCVGKSHHHNEPKIAIRMLILSC